MCKRVSSNKRVTFSCLFDTNGGRIPAYLQPGSQRISLDFSTKISKLFTNIKGWIPSLLLLMSNPVLIENALKSMGLLIEKMLLTVSADIPTQFINFALRCICEA